MKVAVSFDGRLNNGSWDVNEINTVGAPSMIISREGKTYHVDFEPGEQRRFDNRIGLCRAKYMDGGHVKEIYLTSLMRK